MPGSPRFVRFVARGRLLLTRGGLVLIFLAVVAAAAPRLLWGPKIAVDQVVQRDFVQSVVASGRVEAPHRVDVGVQITGAVSHIPVVEGQSVAAGTVLIELESSELKAALAQAGRALAEARARLRQLREVQAPVAQETYEQAKANYANAVQTLARNRQLIAQGFLGQAALDESVRAEQVARSQLRSAQQQLASAGPHGSDMAIAVANVEEAESGVNLARSRLAYAVVTAAAAGTLIARDVEPGDVVQPGRALMVLSPIGETQLVVDIDEKNIGLLQLGQQALASAEAQPDKSFGAEVVYINPGVDAQRGSVEVKLAVPSPPAYLRQDMTISVDIAVGRRSQARLVTATAVHDADAGSPWVYRLAAGRIHRQPIKLGLRGKGLCEVLDGLQPGDLVVTESVATLSDGQRARPLAAISS